eukprot:SM000069S20692  [mRNA]  locus=s69:215964:217593:+ [translate_table: standard]
MAGPPNGGDNLAAWLHGVDDLRLEPFPLPAQLATCISSRHARPWRTQLLEPSPALRAAPADARLPASDSVPSALRRLQQLRLMPTASDLALQKMSLAGFEVKEPMVIGHECSGVVAEVGAEVTRVRVGDELALEPGVACNTCLLCKAGRYNLCRKMRCFATPPTNGSLAQYVVHPEDLCFRLPDGVTLEEGAMCEPLSVAVHACRRAGLSPGAHVAIMGGGPIGLLTFLVARAFGAAKVALLDVHPDRLQFAESLGADVVIPVDIKNEGRDVKQLLEALEGQVDVTFDCVGVTQSMCTALQATSPGGKVCLVGMGKMVTFRQPSYHPILIIIEPGPILRVDRLTRRACGMPAGHDEMCLPITAAAAKEVDVIGVFRYCNTWPLCLSLLEAKKVDVKPLITHRFKFTQEDVLEGFKTSAQGGNAIKVMFKLD